MKQNLQADTIEEKFAIFGVFAAQKACGKTLRELDVEELVQESLLRFYERRYETTFPIRTIAYNLTIDFIKKKPQCGNVSDLTMIPFYPTSNPEHGEMTEFILQNSPARHRKVLEAILDKCDPDSRSLAARTGRKEQTVRQDLSDVRKAIDSALITSLKNDLVAIAAGTLDSPKALQLPMRQQRRHRLSRKAQRMSFEIGRPFGQRPHAYDHTPLELFALKEAYTGCTPHVFTTDIDPIDALYSLQWSRYGLLYLAAEYVSGIATEEILKASLDDFQKGVVQVYNLHRQYLAVCRPEEKSLFVLLEEERNLLIAFRNNPQGFKTFQELAKQIS